MSITFDRDRLLVAAVESDFQPSDLFRFYKLDDQIVAVGSNTDAVAVVDFPWCSAINRNTPNFS